MVGQPITFDGTASSDPDGSIVAYEWDFADCAIGTGPTPTHTYTSAGTYVVTLCVTDDEGGTSCCTTTAQVEGAPGLRAGDFFGKKATELQPMGANPQISFPLHASAGCHDCGPIQVDCMGVRPTVNIPGNMSVTIYLLAFNYSALAAVQTAFDWHSSWELYSAIFDCLPGQLTVVTPVPPGGATAGSVATAFNCVTSGQLLVIGRLLMNAGAVGCLSQVQSSYPNGIHAVDCSLGVDLIPDSQQLRLGKICVAQGGVDACLPVIPVQSATWGQVKATYR
jgi:PKD repeat protein